MHRFFKPTKLKKTYTKAQTEVLLLHSIKELMFIKLIPLNIKELMEVKLWLKQIFRQPQLVAMQVWMLMAFES